MERVAAVRRYYRELFPAAAVAKRVLVAGPFRYREFSFTWAGERVLRFQSFNDADELASYVARTVPVTINVGALYAPRYLATRTCDADRCTEGRTPLAREFVMDVDLPPRECCANACEKCWESVMVPQIEAVWRTAKENGLDVVVMYSGGRGIHAWVLNDYTCQFNDKERAALADVFQQALTVELDRAVSTQTGHLLRMPFSVHSKHGRLCMPVFPDEDGKAPPFSACCVKVEDLFSGSRNMQEYYHQLVRAIAENLSIVSGT